MPRFYFPIIDGTRLDDPTGIELPDTDAAKEHAHRIAIFMPTDHRRHIAVLDDIGNEVHIVQVGEPD